MYEDTPRTQCMENRLKFFEEEKIVLGSPPSADTTFSGTGAASQPAFNFKTPSLKKNPAYTPDGDSDKRELCLMGTHEELYRKTR